jgi:hypothetical protein
MVENHLMRSLVAVLLLTTPVAAAPIRLHPDNPHYFLFRGKPAVLITSGEHYGAVLNLDFDYVAYLDQLHREGFNLTRTFSGAYREVPGSFKIVDNTLAPAPGRYSCPWAAADGKFDLRKWNPAHFHRLRDFLTHAGKHGIVVELSLFCPLYDDQLWAVNPMNARNNVNGMGRVPREEVYTLKHKDLTAVQDALARKVVAEVKDFDNVYLEVCNEPYFGGVTRAWQDHIVATIVDAESKLPARHLIAQNIANGSRKIERPNPHVSIFNFHYATPPTTVGLNHGLNRGLGDDETGFRGTKDLPYRTEGWDFIVAGGAVYSNLDYSFSCKAPRGTAVVTTSPGGGGPALRRQLKALKDFIDGFDFIHMRPDDGVIKGGVPAGATARVLAERGKAYAVYVHGGTRADLVMALPAGPYRAEWVRPSTGAVERTERFEHAGGRRTIPSPAYREDIALRVKRRAAR